MKKIKIAFIIVYIVFMVVLLAISLFFDDGAFIPTNSYKYISYIIAPLLTSFFVYLVFNNNKKTNPLIAVGAFVVFTHLYLLLMYDAIPTVFQNVFATKVEVVKRVIFKHKNTKACSYQLYISNDFYYGRICTNKEKFNSISQGELLNFSGNKNPLGLYLYSYKKAN